MPDKFIKEDDEWKTADGVPIPMCVVEELNADAPLHAMAVITFGGFSLCREHFEKVTAQIRAGIPMGQIVNDMMTTGLD